MTKVDAVATLLAALYCGHVVDVLHVYELASMNFHESAGPGKYWQTPTWSTFSLLLSLISHELLFGWFVYEMRLSQHILFGGRGGRRGRRVRGGWRALEGSARENAHVARPVWR